MRLVRPHYLVFEPRAQPELALRQLLSGADEPAVRWVALAPHLEHEVEVEAADLALFSWLAPGVEVESSVLASRFGPARIAYLVEAGLLIGAHDAHATWRQRDARLREARWWGPAALAQVFGRWDGVDVAAAERDEGRRSVHDLLAAHGPPPPAALAVGAASARQPLPPPATSALDALLGARATCRNFDASADLDAPVLATMLHRVFAAQAAQTLAPGATMLKKTSPSGGGLHPIEAFVLVQRAEGLQAGLYHYQCQVHALEPIAVLDAAAAAAAAKEMVAGQPWVADAPVLVLLAARFARNTWKYPHHAKAWKVVQLDAGHLSQTLLLSATELGLGAFVTAAINDGCAERLFGLDGVDIGAVAVCGFGRRAEHAVVREFDPLGRVPR